MAKCGKCGSPGIKRVHRNFWERLSYMAIYECRECRYRDKFPRRYQFRLGSECRCPRCGTYRLTKLRERDKIDRMSHGVMNLVERVLGGRLYHCCFCRLQFYDRRPLLSRTAQDAERLTNTRLGAEVHDPTG